jgi:hypothetical protein
VRRPLRRRPLAGVALAAALVLGPVACSDEDGDGATTDEEVDRMEEEGGDVRDRVEEEVDRGRDAVDDDDEG